MGREGKIARGLRQKAADEAVEGSANFTLGRAYDIVE